MITKEELEKAQNIIKQHEIEQLRLSRVSNLLRSASTY